MVGVYTLEFAVGKTCAGYSSHVWTDSIGENLIYKAVIVKKLGPPTNIPTFSPDTGEKTL